MGGGTIVCGVNDSVGGRGAAEFAGVLSAHLGLRLLLVYVAADACDGTLHRTNGGRTADRVARELPQEAETRMVAGARALAIVRVAAEEGADLIVVGSRPAGVGGQAMRSTLARELEAATSVPVLVAPPPTRMRTGRA
jgi:nucleotide-binding universal stress UspA family protein